MRSWRCAAMRRTSSRQRRVPEAAATCRRGARRRRPAGRASRSTSRDTPHRVLVLAESDGRRESLLDFLRASRHRARRPSTRWPSSRPRDEKLGIATAPLAAGFAWRRSSGIDFVTETELFAAAPTARRRTKQEQVSDVEALIKDLSELNVGDPVVHVDARHRPLPRPGRHGPGGDEAARRVPAPRIRRQGDALRAGGAAAPDQPLHRRQRRRGAAAPARLAASGRRPSARPPSRCATPPPSCSTSTPAAPRARATPSASRPHDYEAFANELRLRGNAPTRTPRSTP